MKNKKILLVGANGFIGRNLKEFLEGNYSSNYIIDAPGSHELDASDEHAVKKILSETAYDVVINAAVYNPRVDNNKDSSKELTKNLLIYFNFEKYKHLYGKMLYFGSGAEFDKRKEISMVKESDPGNGIPNTDYGLSKYIINKNIQTSENIYNLRLFGLFGKYENWKAAFISGACCKAMKNLPISIRQNVYFDYLYIKDFCKIVKWFIDHKPKYQDYNITSGKRIDLITLAETVKKISSKKIPIIVCKDGFANEYTANNQRMLREIGSFNFTPIEESITDLYNWYKNQEEKIDIYSLIYQ